MKIVETVKTAQESGKIVAVVDMARTFDVCAAHESGVNVSRLLVSQPDDAGQAYEILEALTRSGAVDLIVTLGCEDFSKRIMGRILDIAKRSGTVFA